MILIALKSFAWIVAIIVWAIVGLYLFFPALFSAMIFYVVAVFAVAFLSDKKLRWQAETTLENAATLYTEGFQKLHHAIWGEKPEESSSGLGGGAIVKFLIMSLFSLVGATVFWYLLWRLVLARIIW